MRWFGLFGREEAPPPSEQKIYDDAALKQLWGEVPFLNGVLGDIGPERTAAVRETIAAKRAWVATLEDPRWRRAFSRWLDHAERCCKKADQYHAERPADLARREKQEAERRETQAAARALLETNPPKPGS